MFTYVHSRFSVHQIEALKDNYIYLIEDHDSAALAVVDPADASAVAGACRQLNKQPTHILNTHHHWDHTDGNLQLVRRFGCEVAGFAGDASRIPGITLEISKATGLSFGALEISVIEVPGHTTGHIAFLIDDALFCGDTLFGAGCGRLFEGTPEMMWQSLSSLAALPRETKVYCAHEYTSINLRFARTVDGDNPALKERTSRDTNKRMQKLPTVPSTIGDEIDTNPFLRAADPEFCSAYASARRIDNSPLAVFASLREARNHY